MKTERILWNEAERRTIDEFVIREAALIHIEQMHDGCYWIGIYDQDHNKRMSFNVVGKKLRLLEQDAELEWEEDATQESWKPGGETIRKVSATPIPQPNRMSGSSAPVPLEVPVECSVCHIRADINNPDESSGWGFTPETGWRCTNHQNGEPSTPTPQPNRMSGGSGVVEHPDVLEVEAAAAEAYEASDLRDYLRANLPDGTEYGVPSDETERLLDRIVENVGSWLAESGGSAGFDRCRHEFHGLRCDRMRGHEGGHYNDHAYWAPVMSDANPTNSEVGG